MIDRDASHGDETRAERELISARWEEPTARRAEGHEGRQEGMLGTLALSLEQPILFHIVAEASRLSVLGKGALFPLNHLIGERRHVRIEADVELTSVTYRSIWKEDGLYFAIADLRMALARGSEVHCRSAEGGLVEWLLRAIPAKIIEWIEKALQQNLQKEQLLTRWAGQGEIGRTGLFDGLLARLGVLERLKEEAQRCYGGGHGAGHWDARELS